MTIDGERKLVDLTVEELIKVVKYAIKEALFDIDEAKKDVSTESTTNYLNSLHHNTR